MKLWKKLLCLNLVLLLLLTMLPVQVLAGVAAYVGLSLITRNENIYYLLDYIKSILKRG